MAIPRITNSVSLVTFKTLGKQYGYSSEAAKGFAAGLDATSRSSAVFTHIVIARSVTKEFRTAEQFSYTPLLAMVAIQREDYPFTAEEFQQMMSFPTDISPDEWISHLMKFHRP